MPAVVLAAPTHDVSRDSHGWPKEELTPQGIPHDMICPANIDSAIGKVAMPSLRIGGVDEWEIAHRLVVAAHKPERVKHRVS